MAATNLHIFKKLVDNTSDHVFILEVAPVQQYKLVYFNKAYSDFFNMSPADYLNKWLHEFVPHTALPIVMNRLNNLVQQGSTGSVSYEETIWQNEQTNFFISELFLLPYDGSTFIVGNSKNITEQVIQRQQLRESEKKLESIVNSSNNNIYYFSLDKKILFVNEAAQRHCMKLNGRYYQIGDDIKNYMDPTDYEAGIKVVDKMLQQRTPFAHENVIRYPDGDIKWFYRHYYPTYNSQGILNGFVTASTDITDLKTKEFELKKRDEQLREIAKIQSHEIRRPLANVLGLVAVLKDDLYKESVEQHLELLEKSADELDRVIRKIVFNTI